MDSNMDRPKIYSIKPPTSPPVIAFFLLFIKGNRDENTIIIIKELEPTYKSADVKKFPLWLRLTPLIL